MKRHALQQAAKILGGNQKLRHYLQVPSAQVIAWLSGVEEPPQEVFLKAVNVLLDELDLRDPR